MSSEKHTAEIEVKANVGAAEAQVQRLLDKLNNAQAVASEIGPSSGKRGKRGAGATESTAGQGGIGGEAVAGSATGSTAGEGAETGQAPGSATGSTAGGRKKKPPPTWEQQVSAFQAKQQRAAENREWKATVAGVKGGGATESSAAPAAAASRARGESVGSLPGSLLHTSAGVLSGGPGSALQTAAGGGARVLGLLGDKMGGFGKFGGAVGGELTGIAALAGGGLMARARSLGERAGLEEMELRARTATAATQAGAMSYVSQGGYAVEHARYQRFAERWGMSPQRTAQLMTETALGLGIPGTSQSAIESAASALQGAHLQGISPQGLLALGKTFGPGGGARGNGRTLMRSAFNASVGMTQQLGLSGSRADEAIQTLAGMVGSRAGAGLMTQLGGGGGAIGAMEFALGLGNTGISQVQGTGATRAVARMMQGATGASQGFGGLFGGLGQAGMWGSAFKGARSPQEAMARLNAMDSPQKVREALVGTLGREGAELALYGMGESAATARGIMGARSLGVPDALVPTQEAIESTMPLTRATAQRDARRLSQIDTEQSLRIIEFMARSEELLMRFAAPGGIADKTLFAFNKMLKALGAGP